MIHRIVQDPIGTCHEEQMKMHTPCKTDTSEAPFQQRHTLSEWGLDALGYLTLSITDTIRLQIQGRQQGSVIERILCKIGSNYHSLSGDHCNCFIGP